MYELITWWTELVYYHAEVMRVYFMNLDGYVIKLGLQGTYSVYKVTIFTIGEFVISAQRVRILKLDMNISNQVDKYINLVDSHMYSRIEKK